MDALAAQDFPKLVLAGLWDVAPAEYRSRTGDALVATGETVARRIRGCFRQVPGADHLLHQQRPEEVNRLLRELWERAEGEGARRTA